MVISIKSRNGNVSRKNRHLYSQGFDQKEQQEMKHQMRRAGGQGRSHSTTIFYYKLQSMQQQNQQQERRLTVSRGVVEPQCKICERPFDSESQGQVPMLICHMQHTLCKQCLDELFKKVPPQENPVCPWCRGEIVKEKTLTFRLLKEIIKDMQHVGKPIGQVQPEELQNELKKQRAKNTWLINHFMGQQGSHKQKQIEKEQQMKQLIRKNDWLHAQLLQREKQAEQLKVIKRRNDESQRQWVQLVVKNEYLERNKSENMKNLDLVNIELNQAKQINETLKSQIDELKSALQLKDNEKSEKQLEVVLREKQILQKNRQKDRLEYELRSVEESERGMMKKIDQLNNEIKQKETALTQSNQAMSEASARIEQLQDRFLKLSQRVDLKENLCKGYECENSTIKRQRDISRQELKDIKKDHVHVAQKYKQMKVQLMSTLQKLKVSNSKAGKLAGQLKDQKQLNDQITAEISGYQEKERIWERNNELIRQELQERKNREVTKKNYDIQSYILTSEIHRARKMNELVSRVERGEVKVQKARSRIQDKSKKEEKKSALDYSKYRTRKDSPTSKFTNKSQVK